METKDTGYDVTVNSDFNHPTKGLVQVIYRIKLNADLKLYYLRSYIAAE